MTPGGDWFAYYPNHLQPFVRIVVWRERDDDGAFVEGMVATEVARPSRYLHWAKAIEGFERYVHQSEIEGIENEREEAECMNQWMVAHEERSEMADLLRRVADGEATTDDVRKFLSAYDSE